MYSIAVKLLHPFLLLFIGTGIGIMVLWIRRKVSKRNLFILTLSFVLLYFWCTPVGAYVASGLLEWRFPPLYERPTDFQAIVVLGGGLRRPNQIRRKPELTESSLYRCVHAAQLYKKGARCPVLVSGGKVDPNSRGPEEAIVMKEILLLLGVHASDILVETKSRNTYENAIFSAKVLMKNHLPRIMLVTTATHLPRAVRCFETAGFNVIPYGCDYKATEFKWSVFTFLPSAASGHQCQVVFHELLGILWYKIHKRI